MTNSNNSAKKLYKVFVQKHNPDTEDELNYSATKLNISIDEAAHRVDVFMDVNRKTLKGAYKVFTKAIEQAVADGALDKKVAEFACFADDINDIDFAGKDYFIANDNINNAFAYGIDDNGDNGYYFWFWTLTEAAEEIAEDDMAVEAEIEIVNNTDETAEINERRFLVSVHYDNNGANGMEGKHFATAAEAANYIIAFANENPEYVINTDTNIRDFAAHKKYTLTDADLHILNSKPAAEEIAEINAADVKINVAQDGKIIEQIKVDVDTAINIINRLNYRNDTFVYSNTTREDNADIKYRHFDAYKADGEKDAFAITEYVINGKLEIVRFFNLFRDITVDLQIGNVNYTIGDKGAIVLTADNTPPDNDPLGDIALDEYAISEAAMEVAINAEGHNADVASGNYSVDINGEYVRFENHSIVRIDAMRKMNWIYDHTGANKIFRYGNRKSSAAKVIDMYMNRERADEQGKYFHEFFDQYCKTRGTIEVRVILTYADDREHHFMAEFNQGRLADKFIADVKELAGDTPCQIFKKYRNNYVKPVWEDPHKYETVGNLEHARHLYCEETVDDIAPEEYIITQAAMDVAIEAEEDEALFAKWTAKTLSDPFIEAAYRKARERVEVQFTSYGAPLYTYIKKNGERCYEDFVAKSYISKCGLSETDFIVKARAEAKITRDRRTEKIGDDEVYYVGDKWQCTYSAKYHAGFFRGINSGELMYRVDDLAIVSEQDFWRAMIERGACTIDNDADDNMSDFEISLMLTAKLKKVTRKVELMEFTTQDGKQIISGLFTLEVTPDWNDDDGFIFTNGHETLARYDTKEQCLDVIERLATAIEGGDEEFEFPTAEFVDLENKIHELCLRSFTDKYKYLGKNYWQMRLGGKWRNVPRKLLAADLKYYGLTFAELKEAQHAN